ncbi:hypothetical protein AYO40_03015 [Planctomycetaceae bacterium SCGC AG-212-D15]|nr:hypothetical protein AYO40_03015 [Planctomycetaceae bacterium SCGC AG-212-D15]
MPGQYAQAMSDVVHQGRFHDELLSLALNRLDMRKNCRAHEHFLNYDLAIDDFAHQSSCHPNAGCFMNMVSDTNYHDDMAPERALRDGLAQTDVQNAQGALDGGNTAIWVQYGGMNGHSFVLVISNEVEIFESWAGGGGIGQVIAYHFHRCVLELGQPDRVAAQGAGRPTIANARTHLGNLIAATRAQREYAADRLSRASYGGFDHEDVNANIIPYIGIRTGNLKTVANVRTELKNRLLEVGYYRQRALENHTPGIVVCCHCQAQVSNAVAHQNKWRDCPTCHRHYCPLCKLLMPYLPRPGWFQDRQRPCDGPPVPVGHNMLPCGGVTALM